MITDRQEYESKTLIYAAGTGYRTLGVPGEEAFTGREFLIARPATERFSEVRRRRW